MLQECSHATCRKIDETERNEGNITFIQDMRDRALRFRHDDPESAEKSRRALGQGKPEAAAKYVQSS